MPQETPFDCMIIINRPLMEVFDYVHDPNNILEWFPLYSDIDILPRDETNSGALLSYRATFVGSSVLPFPKIVIDITEHVPGRRLSYRCSNLGARLAVEFEPSTQGTILRAKLSFWGWNTVLLGLLVQPLRPLVNDQIHQQMMILKDRIEERVPEVKPLVFFSYRRSQAKYVGGRIYDALCQEFGEGYVFRDVESLGGGTQWLEGIEAALKQCKIIIAHIDDGWEDEIEKRSEETDILRKEMETAINLQKTMVPVFTSHEDDFSMNLKLERINCKLSSDTIKRALGVHQGLFLRTDPDFKRDFAKIAKTIWDNVRSKDAIFDQMASFREERRFCG
jgi:hypothetical protein